MSRWLRPTLLLLLGCAGHGASPGSPAAHSASGRPAGIGDNPPPPGPPPALVIPPVARYRLANGLAVWIAEQHSLPRVAVALAIRAGAELDPPGRAGLAALCVDMLDEGAGRRGSLAIAEAFADEGADFGSTALHSGVVLRLWSLSEQDNLDRVLGVLGDLVARPRFLASEFARVRADRTTEIARWRDDPAIIAGLTLAQALYGREHAYGRPVDGRAATLPAIRAADVRAFWGRHYRPDNAALIAVGAVRGAELVPMLERALGGWRAPPRVQEPAPAAPDQPGPRLVIVDRPGAAQSEVRLGHVGLARGHRDEYAIEVLSTLLGGSFASRLNNRLREQLGYTYGAWGGFDMRRGPGPLVLGAAVRTDVTAPAVREFLAEVARLREVEPSAQEIERARDGLLRGLPARLEGVSAIAAQLADLFVNDAPFDYFDHYVERIGSVTAPDVHRAAAEHLRPEQLQVAIVGDRRVFETDLASAGLGAPERWDTDGNPAP